MQITVIVAHPNPRSFNHAIAETIVDQLTRNGHDVVFHDLYAEKFNPILLMDEIPQEAHLSQPTKSYCKEISQAEGIIIIHPNWWGQPPAILTGWVDKVLRPGVAYQFAEDDQGEGVPIGLLKAKAAIVLNTSNTQLERELQVFGDPLENIWKNCIFDLCGVKTFYRETFSVVITSTVEQRQEWLQKACRIIDTYFPRI